MIQHGTDEHIALPWTPAYRGCGIRQCRARVTRQRLPPGRMEAMNTLREKNRTPAAPARIPAWAVDVVAVVLVLAFTFAPFPEREFHPNSPVGYAAAVAAAVVVPLRRRWPIPVLGALVALYAVTASTGVLSLGNGLAIGFGVFHVANTRPRRTAVIAAAATAVAAVLLSIYAARESGFDPRVFQFAVSVAFAAAVGDATRSRREYIEAITERAERAEQTREAEAQRRVVEERLRIARDLHDAVAHQIAVISLNAGVASASMTNRPEKAQDSLALIRGAARSVLGEIGDLLNVLRTGEDPAGQPSPPQPDLSRIDDLVRDFATAGMQVTVRTEGDITTVTGSTGIVAYRVLQEALTNAHKHGADDRAHILIEAGDRTLRMTVANPVSGARPSAAPASSGHGLIGIRERVAAVHGSVETTPVAGGYRLTATLPLTKEDPA